MSTSRRLLLTVMIQVLLAMTAPAAVAAAPPETGPAAPDAEADASQNQAEDPQPRDSEYEEYVVVTATRTETPRQRVGSTITVVTPDTSLPRAGRLVTDLLRQVPGLDVRRNGGPGTEPSIFVRGADSDHTLVLVDGIEVNDPSTPSRAPFATHLTLDGVERIEVLRGPQSTLYGADAIGGVVNIITKLGSEKGRLGLWTEGGSYSTASGGLDYRDRFGRTGLALSGSVTETGGFSSLRGGSEDDPYRNETFAGRVTTPLGGTGSLDATLRYARAETGFDGFLAEDDHRIDAEQLLVRVAPTFTTAGGAFEHRIGAQYTESERLTSGSFPSDVRGELFQLDWLGRYEAGRRHVLLFGAETGEERAELASFVDRATTSAVFVQDQVVLGSRWSGTIGARHDDHEAFGGRTTWRATAAYRTASERVVLRASIGTGFKAPSLAELNPDAFGGNPNLGPETSTGADLGVEYTRSDGGLTLGATAFWNAFDELIVAVFDPGVFTFENVNVDEARSGGLELYATALLGSKLRLLGQYTWTDTEARGNPAGFGLADGSPLLRRPRHKGGLTLDWRFAPARRGRLAADLVHVGERKDIDPVTFAATDAEAYTVVHLLGAWGVTDRLTLEARLENVADEDYQDVLGFGTPGRSAYVGLALDLDMR